MTEFEKLKLQLSIDITDTAQDSLLSLLLEDSTAAVCQMTNRTDLTKYGAAVRAVCLIMYNKIGREGLSAYSAGGVSVSYEELPTAVKSLLPQRLVSVAGRIFEGVNENVESKPEI